MTNQTEFTREKGLKELDVMMDKIDAILSVNAVTSEWTDSLFMKSAEKLNDEIKSFKNMLNEEPDVASRSFVYYFNLKYDILKNDVDKTYDEFEKAAGNRYGSIDQKVIANDISGLKILMSKTITTMDLVECALKAYKDKLDIMKDSIEFCKKELDEIENGGDREVIKERIKHLSQQLIEMRKDAIELMK